MPRSKKKRTRRASPAEAYWNHRVVRREYAYGEVDFTIHEAHYEAGKTRPHLITVNGVVPYGESIVELRATLLRMLRALDKPMLRYEEFVDGKSREQGD